MIDLGRVVYLDMQKTGSTYVTGFLKRHLDLPVLRSSMHGRMKKKPPEDTFCFISVRDPLEQYISLYRYGCDGKGGFFKRQKANGLAEQLYGRGPEGFPDWVDFVTEPKNAQKLDPRYAKTAPSVFGFMTFRYLFLALPDPLRATRELSSRTELRDVYAVKSCVSGHVRTEFLSEDLAALCNAELRPFLKNPKKAEAFLRRDDRSNTSKAARITSVDPAIVKKIRAREWFLYETLGYSALTGEPSDIKQIL